jgi:hypothetical protein
LTVAVNDLPRDGRLVPAIFTESSAYYSLGFESADRAVNGRFHEIAVRVNRRDVAVHAKEKVGVLPAAFNTEGRSVNHHWQVLDLSSVTGDAVQPFEFLTRLPLEPGRYEIRAAVTGSDGKPGSVIDNAATDSNFRQSNVATSITVK